MGNFMRSFLLELEKEYQNTTAFIYRNSTGQISKSYSEFMKDVMRKADYCAHLSRQRIGIWAYNSYEWVVAVTGLLLAGKDVVFFNPNLEEKELLGLAEYTDVKMLFSREEMWNDFPAVTEKFILKDISETGAQEEMPGPAEEGTFICFTSGTTKSAKGVVIGTEAFAMCMAGNDRTACAEKGRKVYIPVPLHHIYGMWATFQALQRGRTVCIGQDRYLVSDMEEFAPHTAALVPSMMKYIIKKQYFPSFLKEIWVAGGSLRLELAEIVQAKGITIVNRYGLSETTGQVGHSIEEKDSRWLMPEEGVRFILSEKGEIGICTPWHMTEYYKKEQETNLTLDREKHIIWTGDSGELNQDGMVRVGGRLRDTIVLENGEKIYMEDVDAELSGFKGVKEAAVLGIDGEQAAVFLLETGAKEDEVREQLRERNRNTLPYARILKTWFYQDAFPRTATGKLQRGLLEKEYRDCCQ